MSLLDKFSRNKVPSNAKFSLTEKGEQKMDESGMDARDRVLVAFKTCGTSNVQEIAVASGLSASQVEHIIPQLVRGHYLEYISASMSEDGE